MHQLPIRPVGPRAGLGRQGPPREPGRDRSRFFWACLCAATSGDGAATVALMLRMRPAGPIWLAALIAAALVPPLLIAPVAGTLIDRYGARIAVVLALLGQSAVALGMIAATSPAGTAVLATVHGTLTAFVATGLLTFAPSQARAGTARTAYMRYGTAVALGQIAGPLSAPVLGGTGAFLAESATSFALALACAAARQPTATHIATAPVGTRAVALREAFAGLRRIAADAQLRRALPFTLSGLALATGCAVAVPYRLVEHPGASPSFGLYQAALATGAVLGTQAPRFIKTLLSKAAIGACAGLAAMAAGYLAVAVPGPVPVVIAGAATAGAGGGLTAVVQDCLLRIRTPVYEQGRAFGGAGALVALFSGAATVLAVPAIHAFTGTGSVLAVAALCAPLALTALMQRGSRDTERLPRAHRPATDPPADSSTDMSRASEHGAERRLGAA